MELKLDLFAGNDLDMVSEKEDQHCFMEVLFMNVCVHTAVGVIAEHVPYTCK